MRKITKIERQKKSIHRYNIYIEDEFAFGVDEDVLLKNNLHKGLALTTDDMAQIIDEESTRNAYLLAIRYLSYRIRTKFETERYLREKAVDELLINETIQRLIDEKLIDDNQFAQIFVRDRINQTSKGPRVIARELMEKGIPQKLIKEALTTFTFESQLDKVIKFAKSEMKKGSNKSFNQRLQQIQQKVIRKGFDQEIAKEMMQQLNMTADVDDEKNAMYSQAEKLTRKLQKKFTGYEFNQRLKKGLYDRGFSIDLINKYLDELEINRDH